MSDHASLCTQDIENQHQPRRLKVGTLSSELMGATMRLHDPERSSVAVIIDALSVHQPDVLLTAGHSLHDDDDRQELATGLQDLGWSGLLFVEVKNHGGSPAFLTGASDNGLSQHCLFAWTKEGGWLRLGRQYFTTSQQARDESERVGAFVQNLHHREVEFAGRRFGALICGEINALVGRNKVQALDPRIEQWIHGLNVIVNPTHDLMGNGGTLLAKRTWLSAKERIYISASNWNSAKERRTKTGQRTIKQKREARTLHTLFVNGEVSPLATRPHPNYEYREGVI